MVALRSPLPWIGGKYYSADRIVKAFPCHTTYKTYVEVFGGAAHILLKKLPYKHLEVYNDYNRDLVNFWMQCRNNPIELVALSYYPHQKLDEWYPALKWRRMCWQTYKYSEKTSETRQKATEMLLTNYEPAARELWAEEVLS